MRLNQIKLSGFKSFAEPTTFRLPGQLVGVVGPNGCGKSNIIDAVRWVLGESKASELRGESMQDVIFNGSAQRKPASRASVELVFDNADARAGGQWSAYAEIAVRRDAVWRPYHTKLSEEIGRLKAAHGSVVLWDAHSIRSVLPRFFEGKLPDLNLGTADGVSCDPCLADELLTIVRQDPAYTGILNGRFKGGHITRHFGDPRAGVHAVQLELTQCSYMQEEPPFDYLPECAQRVQPTLRRLLEAALAFAEARGRG